MQTNHICRYCKEIQYFSSNIRLYQRITVNHKQKFIGNGWFCTKCGFIELIDYNPGYIPKCHDGIITPAKRGKKLRN